MMAICNRYGQETFFERQTRKPAPASKPNPLDELRRRNGLPPSGQAWRRETPDLGELDLSSRRTAWKPTETFRRNPPQFSDRPGRRD